MTAATKKLHVGGPVGSEELILPRDLLRTLFTPQTHITIVGCLLPYGWQVVSLRRIAYTEIEMAGALFAGKLTIKPRPSAELAYTLTDSPSGRRLLVDPANADIYLSEGLELVVRNLTDQPMGFMSWWTGSMDRRL